MTTDELREQRRAYVESHSLILRKFSAMDFEAKLRASKTLANIQRQIDSIDAELNFAGAA